MAFDPTQIGNFEMLSNMQGNIIKGHGRDHTAHVFLQFDKKKKKAAKQWLHTMAESAITSAQQQLRDRELFKRNGIRAGLFTGLALSADGYKTLGLAAPVGDSFSKGMKHEEVRTRLSDPKPNKWEAGYRGDIHAMVLLAHHDITELSQAEQTITAAVQSFAEVLHVEHGHALHNENGDGIEHFGYVDGISQPLFLQDEVDAFRAGKTLPLHWDPEAGLDLVLVQDMANNPNAQGSFFVFRKLEQDVKGFKDTEDELAQKLGLTGEDEERAGAMLVGRFEDGTPVTLLGHEGMIGAGAENNFNYEDDTYGAKCPFHAHIRKSNPRGSGKLEPLADEKRHIMARRGIPYDNRTEKEKKEDDGKPSGKVGLLFMSHQASIENQFEFIQEKWVNNPLFPAAYAGSDPVIGQGADSKGWFASKHGNPFSMQNESFGQFVHMKGGEYFFTPSIAFLKSLLGETLAK
jgi:Dyp-type peroxidase family